MADEPKNEQTNEQSGKRATWLAPFRWKPGQSGNPKGPGPMNPELKKLRKLTTEELVEVGTLILDQNITGLELLVQETKGNANSETSALKTWIATIAIRGIKSGNAKSLDILLNRIIGKVPDKMDFTGLNLPQVNINLPANGREGPGTEMIEPPPPDEGAVEPTPEETP